MAGLFQLLTWVIWAAKWIIIAQAIMSWLVQFQVLNLRQPLVWKIWDGLNRILEPVYRPIRRLLPSFGGIDFTPMVVLIAIILLERLLWANLALFS
jgi:YggT family protein